MQVRPIQMSCLCIEYLLGGVVCAEVDGDGGVEAGHDPVEGALLQAHVVNLQNGYGKGQTISLA